MSTLRNEHKIISRLGRVWRDAVQGAPERRVASHTSEGQRSNAPARRETNREVISRTFLSVAALMGAPRLPA